MDSAEASRRGRLGALKRAANLSPERRSEIGRLAAQAVWGADRMKQDPLESSAQLRAWLQRTGARCSDLARMLEVSHGRVWAWMTGHSRMPLGLMDELLLWEREFNED